MEILPWTLLARRNSFHNELQASPAEVVYGESLRLPGDLPAQPTPDQTIQDILSHVQTLPDRPPAQSRPSVGPQHFPQQAVDATHVYVRKPKSKTHPLSPVSDGPFPILERLGNSCLTIQTGNYKSGAPRTELVHWRNCVPACLPDTTIPAQRSKLGRKPKQPAIPA